MRNEEEKQTKCASVAPVVLSARTSLANCSHMESGVYNFCFFPLVAAARKGRSSVASRLGARSARAHNLATSGPALSPDGTVVQVSLGTRRAQHVRMQGPRCEGGLRCGRQHNKILPSHFKRKNKRTKARNKIKILQDWVKLGRIKKEKKEFATLFLVLTELHLYTCKDGFLHLVRRTKFPWITFHGARDQGSNHRLNSLVWIFSSSLSDLYPYCLR